MKYFFTIILFSACLTVNFAQKNPEISNAYTAEESGYFICPSAVYNGVVVTDNYCNSLYLIKDNQLTELVSAPGCGRYYSVSPDKKLIGFKFIENGKQAPALFNLETMNYKLLHEPVAKCSQPVFSADGSVCFSIEKDLFVMNQNNIKHFKLDFFSNIISISPDGNKVVYSNDNNELLLHDLNSGDKKVISENGKVSSYPQWSPDGNNILFQSEDIFIYQLNSNSKINLGKGLYPKWSGDSEQVIFYKTETDNDKLSNSDLYVANFKDKSISRLTQTEDIKEMQVVFSGENTVIFHTYDDRSVYSADIQSGALVNLKQLYHQDGKLNIKFYNIPKTKTDVRIPGTVPYAHQVYDTPDWHYGYGSCAPTCAIMALAYFNRLPKWPITASSPYTHISDYGSYVADKYTSDEYYFDDVEPTSGGDDAWGGYGYMWGLGSPNSYMASYIQKHYLASNQLWTSSCTFTSTATEINNGYPHPMCAMLTSSGHLVLAIGYVAGQYTLIFNDPYGNKNSGYMNYNGQDSYYDWPGENNGYENLDYNGSYGYIAWTVTAQGTEVAYNDTLIDDLFYNHGFNVNNSQNGSHMRYFHDLNTGYNNHMWFTYTMASLSDICWVTWEPTLQNAGLYEVLAYIPSQSAGATGARYKIHHQGGDSLVIINQSLYNNQWVSLGTFNFDAGAGSYVYLGDSTGIDDQEIAFDAVKWIWIPVPQASFSSDQIICQNESVQFNNTTSNATAYNWIFEGGNPSVSSDEDPLVTYTNEGIYDVTLIATGTNGSDTIIMTDYITVYQTAFTDFSANDTLLYLPNAIATFINNSSGSSSYLWDFGNGMTSTDQNPYCIYNIAGDYTISLVGYNSLCKNDTLIKNNYIHILNGTGLNKSNEEELPIYPNPFNDNLVIHENDLENIRLIDMSGKVLLTKVDFNRQSESYHLNTSKLCEGSYFIELTYSDNSIRYVKIVKIK